MTGRNIVIVVVLVVIIALVAYFLMKSSSSGFYDGVVFDYIPGALYAPGGGLLYYEDAVAAPCCDRPRAIGCCERPRCEPRCDRRASLAEAIALRNAANVQELKRKAAEYREMAAHRDMRREAALKRAAESESRSLRSMADVHERLSRDEAASAASAMAIADSAGARIADIKGARQMALMERAGCPMIQAPQPQQQMMMAGNKQMLR